MSCVWLSRKRLWHVSRNRTRQTNYNILIHNIVLFRTFPLRAHVPFFHISYSSITMILASASSSCFTLAVPMRDVPCVEYTPRAWDPRSYSPC